MRRGSGEKEGHGTSRLRQASSSDGRWLRRAEALRRVSARTSLCAFLGSRSSLSSLPRLRMFWMPASPFGPPHACHAARAAMPFATCARAHGVKGSERELGCTAGRRGHTIVTARFTAVLSASRGMAQQLACRNTHELVSSGIAPPRSPTRVPSETAAMHRRPSTSGRARTRSRRRGTLCARAAPCAPRRYYR